MKCWVVAIVATLLLAVGVAYAFVTGAVNISKFNLFAVHILDYKPDARTNRPIAQLTIYALALTKLVPGFGSSTSNAPGSTKKNIANFPRARCSHGVRRLNLIYSRYVVKYTM